mmetsp:Transcript_24542/g.46545  ORF Transcript_24542/g.46545 Transcript_24542/m.46545 type:complete len:295 (+) Transcript_24542:3791-4675(+)
MSSRSSLSLSSRPLACACASNSCFSRSDAVAAECMPISDICAASSSRSAAISLNMRIASASSSDRSASLSRSWFVAASCSLMRPVSPCAAANWAWVAFSSSSRRARCESFSFSKAMVCAASSACWRSLSIVLRVSWRSRAAASSLAARSAQSWDLASSSAWLTLKLLRASSVSFPAWSSRAASSLKRALLSSRSDAFMRSSARVLARDLVESCRFSLAASNSLDFCSNILVRCASCASASSSLEALDSASARASSPSSCASSSCSAAWLHPASKSWMRAHCSLVCAASWSSWLL